MPRKIPPPPPGGYVNGPPDDDDDDNDRDYWAERYAELMSDAFGHDDYFVERSQIDDPDDLMYVTTGELRMIVEALERDGKGAIKGKHGLAATYRPSNGRINPLWYHTPYGSVV